jgi:hypothetical protein
MAEKPTQGSYPLWWADTTLSTRMRRKSPAMLNHQERVLRRSSHRRFAIRCTLALLLQTVFGPTAESATLSVNGITFSDKLGGFILEKATGEGSMDDPFVLVERITDINGGILSFQVPPEFGNRIGSQHAIGFAMVKVIENATNLPWTSFEVELHSQLGTASDYFDGLSFGQDTNAGRPFTASAFDQITITDEPYDRVEFDHGRVPIGGHVTLRFVITESLPLGEAYLLQRPSKPVAEAPSTRSNWLALR